MHFLTNLGSYVLMVMTDCFRFILLRKTFFEITTIETDTKVKIPKKTLEVLHFEVGEELVILRDENTGLALFSKKEFMKMTKELLDKLYPKKLAKGRVQCGFKKRI